METINSLSFPALPYSYDSLEPYIDKQTMEIHYTKHHKAYFDNYVNAVKSTTLEHASLETIFSSVSKQAPAIRNNAGGFYNHNLFWSVMKQNGVAPSAAFTTVINNSFSSFDEFKRLFGETAKTRFGSGWAWLTIDENKKLFIHSTPNQDNPLMDVSEKKGIPLLGLDVWEHAYYLKYQNRRPEYIENWWNVVNWAEVEKRYNAANA